MILFTALIALSSASIAKDSLQSAEIEAKVNSIVSKMTLDEELSYVEGVDGFYVHDISRLGIPRFKMSDGPVGLRNDGPATAYPSGVALAATWDRDASLRFGDAIGKDARARGVNFWLGPGVNLDRIPQNGRNFEYLGEDPFLASQMVVPIVQGVQAHQVSVTVKHYVANDHENERTMDSSEVDERTLREIQMAPFEAAVKAGAWAIMTSYNLVNGTYMSESKQLLDVLKKDWGFKGVVMSDWGSVHSVENLFNGGLDLEMPGGEEMTPENLKPLIQSGKLEKSILDDKVKRILRVALNLHWLDRPQLDKEFPFNNPANDKVALKEAEEAITLLKNSQRLLPLNPSKPLNIVVVGPNAQPPVTGGGGSSYVQPATSIGLIDAIKQVAPDAHIVQLPWTTGFNIEGGEITSEMGKGFAAAYFANRTLSGAPKTRLETSINHQWSGGPIGGIGHNDFSARWTGSFTPDSSGDYAFHCSSDDGMRVFVDGKKVIDMWQDQGETPASAVVPVMAGQSYKVVIEYYQAGGDAIARFGIRPQTESMEKSMPAQTLKDADVVIGCFGFNPGTESEGRDRTWALPQNQQDAINWMEDHSSHSVLIVNAGGAIDLAPFVDKAGAIIDSYYPGENGDLAVAEALFGKIDPSGRLPFTMPTKLKDLLSTGSYPPVDHKIVYKEGIFIGQRGLDKQGIKALFPFGFGLTYTKFSIQPGTISRPEEGWVVANGSIKNDENVAGAEVVQVYVSFPDSPVERPVTQLCGFQRVEVAAGSAAAYRIPIDLRKLGYWDIETHNWKIVPGKYTLWIGENSESTPHRATFEISQAQADRWNSVMKP